MSHWILNTHLFSETFQNKYFSNNLWASGSPIKNTQNSTTQIKNTEKNNTQIWENCSQGEQKRTPNDVPQFASTMSSCQYDYYTDKNQYFIWPSPKTVKERTWALALTFINQRVRSNSLFNRSETWRQSLKNMWITFII